MRADVARHSQQGWLPSTNLKLQRMKPFVAVILLSFLSNELVGQGLNWNSVDFAKRERIQPTRDILPSSASLKRYAPYTHSQYGSTCVAFSLATARTILYAKRNGMADQAMISANSFSPWFIYFRNKSAADRDVSLGLDPDKAVTDILNNGVQRLMKVEFGDYYPFTDRMLANYYPPSYAEDVEEAQNYTLEEAYRLETIDEMRFALSKGMPIMIGMMPSGSFEHAVGVPVWNPGVDEVADPENAHAMVVVGYDDVKYGGAVELLNSWGNAWGSAGYIWVRYADVRRFTAGAYALSDAAATRYRKEAPVKLMSPEAAGHDTTAWRAMSDFKYKCGTPEATITQFKGLAPTLLVD